MLIIIDILAIPIFEGGEKKNLDVLIKGIIIVLYLVIFDLPL